MNTEQKFIIREEDGKVYVLFGNSYRRVFKKVAEMNILKISPKCYNVIRSFVESSNKDKYTWNTGIIVANKTPPSIQFIKMHKWVLVIDPDGIKLLRYDYMTGADAAVLYIPSRDTNIIDVCGHQVSIDAISQLSTVITSEARFAREIYLYEVVRKISEYIDF